MLKPSLVHSCFDQNKILAYVEPLLHLPISKEELTLLWKESAEKLGQDRPATCRCNYRVTTVEADRLVAIGVASFLITEWRYNEDKRVFFPAPNPNLVWGGAQAEELGLVRASLAPKTPRVQTIEKAHIERAYVGTALQPNGDADEQERIRIWGEMQKELWSSLTVLYAHDWKDPFAGRSTFAPFPGHDQRTCVGKFSERKSL